MENRSKIDMVETLKIALITDDDKNKAYVNECSVVFLDISSWKDQIAEFIPDFIMFESPIDPRWNQEIDLFGSYCNQYKYPIVFWYQGSLYGSVQYEKIFERAEYIYISDVDTYTSYQCNYPHKPIEYLQYAIHPYLSNPFQQKEREDKVWCHNKEELIEQIELRKWVEFFLKNMGGIHEIEDTQNHMKDTTYRFVYHKNKETQTIMNKEIMSAIASNTIVISNYNRGVSTYLGDLVLSSDDIWTLEKKQCNYCSTEQQMHKYRLAGLRKILEENTYEQRIKKIVDRVLNKTLQEAAEDVALIAYPKSYEEVLRAVDIYNCQTYKYKTLIVVTTIPYDTNQKDIICIKREEALNCYVGDAIEQKYLAILNMNDYYGKNYIKDMMLLFQCGSCDGIGKGGYYKTNEYGMELCNPNKVYHAVSELEFRNAIIKKKVLGSYTLLQLEEEKEIKGNSFWSADEFNYCKNCLEDRNLVVEDMEIVDTGLSIEQIERIIRETVHQPNQIWKKQWKGMEWISQVIGKTDLFQIGKDEDGSYIESYMKQEQYKFMFLPKESIQGYVNQNVITVEFIYQSSITIEFILRFFNEMNEIIAVERNKGENLLSAIVPEKAYEFQIGVKMSGPGIFRIYSVKIGSEQECKSTECYIMKSDVMIVAYEYPSYENVIHYAFVHRRVAKYKEYGKIYNVFSLKKKGKKRFSEYEGIDIIEGNIAIFREILKQGRIRTVCVHVLNYEIWQVLKEFSSVIKIRIWIHGAEIRPWWRNVYSNISQDKLEQEKIRSLDRMKLWNEVFNISKNMNIVFIMVSQYFANIIFEDYQIELEKNQYRIIHNCIDTQLFQYHKKTIEDRKKILVIRSYKAYLYANDLMANTIHELAKQPFFNELQILIVGDGILFDSIVEPLRQYKNVKIERRILRQNEIAKKYDEYGVFLIPTRLDTQGVSRDEAMASGLVPITNRVAAIPEFVDEQCGIVVEAEDYRAMADGIVELYNNPEKYCMLSQNAAKRIRSQSSEQHTITKEIYLIEE